MMSGRPVVSVITIFWNAEPFLAEAIASVLAQTYPHWELLLVDDGSTDGSPALAQQWAAKHPARIRYLAHPGRVNRGMSASRNLGLRHARGAYIAFLDADDVWYWNTLADQVALLDAVPEAALVYGPTEWWYSWTGQSEDCDRDVVEPLGVRPNRLVEPPKLLWRFLLDRAAVPTGYLIRRRVVEQRGGFEDAFRGEYEDQVFCAKVCLNEPIFVASQCWYRYRQHPDSCVAIGHREGRTRSARLQFLTWLAGYLQDQGVTDRRVWWAVEIELWRFHHPRVFRLIKLGRRLERRVRERGRRGANRRIATGGSW